MASLNSAFLVAYGLMYLGGGRLMDVVGTRLGFALIMVFWSLACASHGLANGVMMLVISRLLLGIGEGGRLPCCHASGGGMVPGGRTFNCHGNHERRHCRGRNHGTAVDCGGADVRRLAGIGSLAMGVFLDWRNGTALDALVVSGVFLRLKSILG